ncbi:MAG TPA: WhiB family transcriptional regulator [Streptosporangiaceae bacterium]|nr:WhiB family transcriptional regulator [Streptosporangiaceae bacterium]
MLSDEWWSAAACRNAEPDLFFPISATPASKATIQRAKQVCASCPVSAQCLSYALHHRQEQGIWGGLTDDERRLLSSRQTASERRARSTLAYRATASLHKVAQH